MSYLTSLAAQLAQRSAELRAAHRVKEAQQVNTPPVPPLVDQVRDLLATLPDAQKQRISLPLLLPHLQGKYRDTPHLIHVARAMKQLGYRQIRSWKKCDAGCRYWVKN